ncbi:MAG TPA: alpha/beta hydrolase [Stellaceae bacterium]|jgi:pimeloyl-ACP methyl ester carboxylesterase|nr:alpha/beta hydrolase [Stellaceae bacterium]
MPQAKAADGTSLYYESQGSGPAIVFVHELAGTCHSFDLQVAVLKDKYRCITFNARGYPPSDVPASIDAYSQDIAASDIGAVLDAAGEKDAHVMGVSMGSAAALQFAIAHPNRARSAILCSIGSGSDTPPQEYPAFMEAMAAKIDKNGLEQIKQNFTNSPARLKLKEKSPVEYAKFLADIEKFSVQGLTNTIRGVQKRRAPLYAHKDQIAALRVPALVVLGGIDQGCEKPSRFLAETLLGARLEILPNTGHGVNLEEPDRVNQMVAEFIGAVEAKRK